MSFPILDNVAKTARHTTFYLSCGGASATPIVFVHGWPELSVSWRGQLPAFAALGFRAIAPDMRGYGRSSVYPRHEDYALEAIVADMVELLGALGRRRRSGSATTGARRSSGRSPRSIPSFATGLRASAFLISRRGSRSKPRFLSPTGPSIRPTGFRRRNGTISCSIARVSMRRSPVLNATSAGPSARSSARAIRRPGANRRAPPSFAPTAATLARAAAAPDLPRDPAILDEEEERRYASALERNGFFGPCSWYMNWKANLAYAERAKANWRLEMPVLFLHAEYDVICETIVSRLADPMRANCANLTEAAIASGHWMAQEKPVEVNAALAKWLGAQFPALWVV